MLGAVAISLLAHAALLGGAWSLTRGAREAPEPTLTVEAPLGDVFVKDDTTAAKSGNISPETAAAIDSSLANTPAPLAPGGPAASPGLPGGEAHPVGRIHPEYPAMSRKLGEEGEAIFVLELRTDGTVAGLHLDHTSGHERLDEAAARALRGARFEPATQNGAPVASEKRFRVEFRLSSPRFRE